MESDSQPSVKDTFIDSEAMGSLEFVDLEATVLTIYGLVMPCSGSEELTSACYMEWKVSFVQEWRMNSISMEIYACERSTDRKSSGRTNAGINIDLIEYEDSLFPSFMYRKCRSAKYERRIRRLLKLVEIEKF